MQEVKQTSLFIDANDVFYNHCNALNENGSRIKFENGTLVSGLKKLDSIIVKEPKDINLDIETGDLEKRIVIKNGNMQNVDFEYKDQNKIKTSPIINFPDMLYQLGLGYLTDNLECDQEENNVEYSNIICTIHNWKGKNCAGLNTVNEDIKIVSIENYHLLYMLPFTQLRKAFPNYKQLVIENLVSMKTLDFSQLDNDCNVLPNLCIIQDSVLQDIQDYTKLSNNSLVILKSLIDTYEYELRQIFWGRALKRVQNYDLFIGGIDTCKRKDLITSDKNIGTCKLVMKALDMWDNHVFYGTPDNVYMKAIVSDEQGNKIPFNKVSENKGYLVTIKIEHKSGVLSFKSVLRIN